MDAGMFDLRPGGQAVVLPDGRPGTAVIRAVSDTGVNVRGDSLLRLTLDVQPDGGTPYPSDTGSLVPDADRARAVPGATVRVRIDQAQPTNVVIDWAPTLARGGLTGAARRREPTDQESACEAAEQDRCLPAQEVQPAAQAVAGRGEQCLEHDHGRGEQPAEGGQPDQEQDAGGAQAHRSRWPARSAAATRSPAPSAGRCGTAAGRTAMAGRGPSSGCRTRR